LLIASLKAERISFTLSALASPDENKKSRILAKIAAKQRIGDEKIHIFVYSFSGVRERRGGNDLQKRGDPNQRGYEVRLAGQPLQRDLERDA
jgi:hypothetical protein